MVNETMAGGSERAHAQTDLDAAARRVKSEGAALRDTAENARDAVVEESRQVGAAAASRLGAEADEARDEAAAGLTAFSDALKSASQTLAGKEMGFAGDVVAQAADGLETLARSLEGKSSAEMLAAVRSFGRQNPVGFIAGSVLAGFAVGRLAAATPGNAGEGKSAVRPAPDPYPSPLGSKPSGPVAGGYTR